MLKNWVISTASTFLDKLGVDGDRVMFKLAILAHRLGLKKKIDTSKPYHFGTFSLYLDAHDTLQVADGTIRFEPTETETLLSLVRPDTTMLDIGANMGYYSVRVAQKATSGRVYAFEPDPGNFAILQKNITLNGLTNVRLFNAALSDKPGHMRLYKHPFNVGDYRLYNDGDFTEFVDVPTLRLDDAITDRIDLIKIDVQGFEYFVLKGGYQLLRRDHPLVISEFWPRGLYNSGSSPAAYLRMMQELGYAVREIDEKKNTVIDRTYEELFTLSAQPSNRYTNLLFHYGA